MQHPMMRPAEAVIGEQPIGIGDEVAIGEEQELDQLDDLLVGRARRLARGGGLGCDGMARAVTSVILTYPTLASSFCNHPAER